MQTRADAALAWLAERYPALRVECHAPCAWGVVEPCHCAAWHREDTDCWYCRGLGYLPWRDLEAVLVVATMAEPCDFSVLTATLEALEEALELYEENPTDVAIIACARRLGWQEEEWHHFDNPQDAIAWLKEPEGEDDD